MTFEIPDIRKSGSRQRRTDKRSLISFGLILLLAASNIIVYFVYGTDAARYGFSVRTAVVEGETYRLITYMFIHGGIEHLAMNTFSMIVVGKYLSERRGPIFLMTVYFAGGLAGAVASMYYTVFITEQIDKLTVGASGGVFALLGAAFAESAVDRRSSFLRVTLGAVICLAASAGLHIDSAAHVGGFLFGVIFSIVMYIIRNILKALIHGKGNNKKYQ